MPYSARYRAARVVVLLLYVLASTTVGFAHRPASAIPPDLAQFALPDGTLPIICGKNGANHSGDGVGHLPLCDACCLTAAPGLLLPAAGAFPAQAPTALVVWTPWQTVTQPFWTVAALGARGPPVARQILS